MSGDIRSGPIASIAEIRAATARRKPKQRKRPEYCSNCGATKRILYAGDKKRCPNKDCPRRN